MNTRSLRGPLNLPFVLAGTVLLGVVVATETWVWLNLWPLKVSWPTALAWSLPLFATWFLLIPAAAVAARHWPLGRGARRGAAVVHLAASVAFGVAAVLIVDASDRILHWTTLIGAPANLVANVRYTIIHVHLGIALYWVVIGALHASHYRERLREEVVQAARLGNAAHARPT